MPYSNTFTNGTTADAEEVNENFTEAARAVNRQLHTTNAVVANQIIQYGYKSITCASGSDNASGTITLPTAYDNASYAIVTGGVNTASFATLNETPIVNWSTQTSSGFVIVLYTRAGTWAANRTTTVWWMTIGTKS